MTEDTTSYEHAFPARQETPEGEPTARGYCYDCRRVMSDESATHHLHGLRHRVTFYDAPSQVSPVGEAPRETAVWRCPCGEYETTVLHEDGEARIVSRRTEARQPPSREETSEAVRTHDEVAQEFVSSGFDRSWPYTALDEARPAPAPTPEEAVCAYMHEADDGIPYECGFEQDAKCDHCHLSLHVECPSGHPFVPRTSEEPTEHLSVEWSREPLQTGTSRSFVSWTAPDGDVTVIREDLEQAIARQAAAPLERRIAVLEASVRTLAGTAVAASDEYEAAESRVATLERELADRRRFMELVFQRNRVMYEEIANALARPRSTESAPEEGSDE